MQLHIRSQNINLPPHLEEFAQNKLGKLDRYLPNITDLSLELSRKNAKRGADLTIAQITLRHSRGAILRAEERISGDDQEAVKKAVNAACDKMFRQIQRFKGKVKDRRRRSGKPAERFIATQEELDIAEEVPHYEEIAEEYNAAYDETADEIVRRKALDLSPMSEQEAIEQMELLGHKFFMFLNDQTGNVNVVYIRDGGGYGVLLPANG
ncbi:MAG: ribosome-associated translation inhibitor RaiA [Anaerolineaceae bacterium]|nr:MAG: ribosome-associated translation inhibitor RaiA [Anaerolineaceae bacterium]